MKTVLEKKDIFNQIEILDSKMNTDIWFKRELYEKYLPNQKYDTNQNYIVISRYLEKELDIKGYGKSTVWRILKIRRTDKGVYNRLKNEEISLGQAYEMLFPAKPKKEETKEEKSEVVAVPVTDFQNVDDMRKVAEEMKEKLMNMELDKSDLESLNQLHMVLFRTSKFIMKKTAELVETLTDEELGV